MTKNSLFEKAKTYQADLELFRQLGLIPFITNDQKKIYVGTYKLPFQEKANIKIFVTCMPAQFWYFEIETDENNKFEVSTGSGTLSHYWNSIYLIAQGMLVMKNIKND